MSILRHTIAAMLSAGFLIAVAITVYFVCAAIGNDAGGPMVPFLIPLFAVIGGIGTTLIVYFPIAFFFQWLSRKMRVRFWIPPLMFFALAFLFFVVWLVFDWKRLPSFEDFGLAALCGLFFTGGFTVYWLVLVIGQRLFRRHESAG
jgi:hypothetical protein